MALALLDCPRPSSSMFAMSPIVRALRMPLLHLDTVASSSQCTVLSSGLKSVPLNGEHFQGHTPYYLHLLLLMQAPRPP